MLMWFGLLKAVCGVVMTSGDLYRVSKGLDTKGRVIEG